MRERILSAPSRIPRVSRGDGRTVLVALLLFALMALIAAVFTAVVPVPLSDRSSIDAPGTSLVASPPQVVVRRR